MYFGNFRIFLERDNPGELVILDNECEADHRLFWWEYIKKTYSPW